jgi:hypothetical protein
MEKISKLKVTAIVAVIGISLFLFGFTKKSYEIKTQETKTTTLKHLKLKKVFYSGGKEYFNFNEGSGSGYFEFMLSADPYTTGSGTINGFYYYYQNGVGTVYSGYTASGTYTFDGDACTINVIVTNTSTGATIPYSGVATYGNEPDF